MQAALPLPSAGNSLVILASSCLPLAGTQRVLFLSWAGESHGMGTIGVGAQLSAGAGKAVPRVATAWNPTMKVGTTTV